MLCCAVLRSQPQSGKSFVLTTCCAVWMTRAVLCCAVFSPGAEAAEGKEVEQQLWCHQLTRVSHQHRQPAAAAATPSACCCSLLCSSINGCGSSHQKQQLQQCQHHVAGLFEREWGVDSWAGGWCVMVTKLLLSAAVMIDGCIHPVRGPVSSSRFPQEAASRAV